MMNKKSLLLGLMSLTLFACYSPDPFVADYSENSGSSSEETAIGKLFPVDGDENNAQQTCNPSVSQDTVNFPASMLWLNFTKLKVNKHDAGYSVTDVRQHDRLTVSDTANNVKWYLMIDEDKGECQFQDPEWSTHADYIVALRGKRFDSNQSCGDALDFGIFAVRTSDKKKFWFKEEGIIEEATPHVWVDPAVKSEGDGDNSSVESFFGTKNVRLTYIEGDKNPQRKIVFVDYANGAKSIRLKKPAGREDWNIDSPLISPDGNFVVYNMKDGESTWEAYIQELSENSKAIKIERTKDMMSEPAQPHWFAYNGRLFVLWTDFPANTSKMQNKVKLLESSVQDGSAGRTLMREIRLTAGAPSDVAVEWVGDNRVVTTVPMMGGRSPDGKFLATGTDNAYLLKLP
ncbi:hypothetical protein [Fibrobacter sp. UWB12]|uniref:hypothetical protein n=1 Tax=Fibrobacter sp. UWB12 TaxID=1896203 RepID=UPI00091D5F88|nr:hypothetical protein [Fibrobacter sp. UWB12]SHK38841.1 hypothetical protein SAMN05720759_102239 [Fibrobacter sp. UWB12]